MGAPMMKRVLVTAVMLALSTPVAAQQDMQTLVGTHLRWIEANSSYKELTPPRYWMELPADQFKSYAMNRGMAYDVVAMHECGSRTMTVLAGFDTKLEWNKSIVLHELVHDAQCQHRSMMADPCGREREAHALQAKWLRERAAAYSAEKHKKWFEERAQYVEAQADVACSKLRR